VTGGAGVPRGPLAEFGRFLEIQNLGLNLPFAIAFLLVAAHGLPGPRTLVLVVVAFVAARNAGHAFNRWADRDLDRGNPRTRDRAVASGRYSGRFALVVAAASGGIFLVAAALLNPLALLLAPVALALVLGYSYSKRLGWGTTVYLGLVEAVTPVAAFVAVLGTLPPVALVAAAGMLSWGTSFETIHSLGDLSADRASGLSSIPVRFGERPSLGLLPVLHAAALVAFFSVGRIAGLGPIYDLGLGAIAVLAGLIDWSLWTDPRRTATSFRRHVALGLIFLIAVVAALWVAL
jgi:4-hydroxybenzoate polyprenyltransferase